MIIAAILILYAAMMVFLAVALVMATKADPHVEDQQEDEEQQRFLEEWMDRKKRRPE